MIITQPPAKIKGLSGHYNKPPCIAFAFLLTPNRLRAISSALLCLVQRSSLTIPWSLASSVPGVEHWCGQPCIWPGIYGSTEGRRQPNYQTTGHLASRHYRCPRSSALFSATPRQEPDVISYLLHVRNLPCMPFSIILHVGKSVMASTQPVEWWPVLYAGMYTVLRTCCGLIRQKVSFIVPLLLICSWSKKRRDDGTMGQTTGHLEVDMP